MERSLRHAKFGICGRVYDSGGFGGPIRRAEVRLLLAVETETPPAKDTRGTPCIDPPRTMPIC